MAQFSGPSWSEIEDQSAKRIGLKWGTPKSYSYPKLFHDCPIKMTTSRTRKKEKTFSDTPKIS